MAAVFIFQAGAYCSCGGDDGQEGNRTAGLDGGGPGGRIDMTPGEGQPVTPTIMQITHQSFDHLYPSAAGNHLLYWDLAGDQNRRCSMPYGEDQDCKLRLVQYVEGSETPNPIAIPDPSTIVSAFSETHVCWMSWQNPDALTVSRLNLATGEVQSRDLAQTSNMSNRIWCRGGAAFFSAYYNADGANSSGYFRYSFDTGEFVPVIVNNQVNGLLNFVPGDAAVYFLAQAPSYTDWILYQADWSGEGRKELGWISASSSNGGLGSPYGFFAVEDRIVVTYDESRYDEQGRYSRQPRVIVFNTAGDTILAKALPSMSLRSPAILQGDLLAWLDFSEGGYQVFTYDLKTGEESARSAPEQQLSAAFGLTWWGADLVYPALQDGFWQIFRSQPANARAPQPYDGGSVDAAGPGGGAVPGPGPVEGE